MNGGDKMYVLGKTGQYKTDLSETMTFAENSMQLSMLKSMDMKDLQQ